MTRIYNKRLETTKRQQLRRRSPKAEQHLWHHLRRRQILGIKFCRQYSVERFVLDFYSPELKLAIEIDGPTHQGSQAQEYDQHRQQFIESLGIQFLRFTNQDIYHNLDNVLATLRTTIQQKTKPKSATQ
ncbi:MAG: endonuclease domain-containing protein [Cyanobacteria bacterium P01_F01_bin.53]